MNTSINQDANAIANLQRHEIPSKNPEDILNIKTSLQNKIGSIVKKTLYTVSSLGELLQPCRNDEKLNIIKKKSLQISK